MPVKLHRLRGVSGRAVVAEKFLKGREQIGLVAFVVGLERGDRLRTQLLELGRVPEQDPHEQPVGLVGAGPGAAEL